MNAQQIERILNTLNANKNGQIRGKGSAIDMIQSLHLREVERLTAIVGKQEELIKHMGEWFGTGNTTLNRLKSELEKLKAE